MASDEREGRHDEPGSGLESWVDLVADRVGGRALLANDEFFAPKENLLLPGRGVFLADKYTDRGKWMDGWETRRRRSPGNDWVILRLGLPGVIHQILVDTNHFRGNYPEACSLEVVRAQHETSPEVLTRVEDWREILPRSPLAGHQENRFDVAGLEEATHARFQIYPDGGVARLRLLGEARPDWPAILAKEEAIDLAAVEQGGRPVACSDAFFSQPRNLLMPGRGAHMGDGWETRRRRGPGHDWVVVALGCRGMLDHALVDTHHFKGNFPESCSLEGCDAPGASAEELGGEAIRWRELLVRTPLAAHRTHTFPLEVGAGPVTHVRFSIFPDGGVSRLRLFGRPD